MRAWSRTRPHRMAASSAWVVRTPMWASPSLACASSLPVAMYAVAISNERLFADRARAGRTEGRGASQLAGDGGRYGQCLRIGETQRGQARRASIQHGLGRLQTSQPRARRHGLRARDAARNHGTGAEAGQAAAAQAGSDMSVCHRRKEGKLFVRKGFEPVFDVPVTFEEPDRPLGTHVFTALALNDDNTTLRWNVVSMSAAGAAQAEVGEGQARRAGGRTDAADVECHRSARSRHYSAGCARTDFRVDVARCLAHHLGQGTWARDWQGHRLHRADALTLRPDLFAMPGVNLSALPGMCVGISLAQRRDALPP